MNDRRPKSLKLTGEIGHALAAVKALQGITISKEIYQIGEIARSIKESAGIFSLNENFHKIGSAVQAFASVIPSVNIVVGSQIGQAMEAIRNMDIAFNTSKSIIAAARAVDAIGISQRNIAALLNSSVSSELFELIRSGRISAAQIESGFEEAVAAVGDVEDFPPVTDPVNDSAASKEVVNAFLSNGNLKGLSHGALVYFLFLVLAAFAKDPIGNINKGFELQRNISRLFTSVETPAAARAQARHLPPGANKNELVGFRIVTGVDVHLMDEPSRQSGTVLKIRIGSLVQVLDSADRAWLYVSVVMDDELYEGWILRSYTKRIE